MPPKFQRVVILGLISIGVLIVGFFGLRALFAFREFRHHGPPPPRFEAEEAQPIETDVELIRDWMTIPYIAMTYHVHPKMLFDIVGVPHRGNEDKSLLQLNEEFFPKTPGIVIELVKAAISADQSAPPDSPEPPAAP